VCQSRKHHWVCFCQNLSVPEPAESKSSSRTNKAAAATIVTIPEEDKYARKDPAQMMARAIGYAYRLLWFQTNRSRNRVPARATTDEVASFKRPIIVLVLLAVFFVTLIQVCGSVESWLAYIRRSARTCSSTMTTPPSTPPTTHLSKPADLPFCPPKK
jgi:hypothetical protein